MDCLGDRKTGRIVAMEQAVILEGRDFQIHEAGADGGPNVHLLRQAGCCGTWYSRIHKPMNLAKCHKE